MFYFQMAAKYPDQQTDRESEFKEVNYSVGIPLSIKITNCNKLKLKKNYPNVAESVPT